MNGRERFLTASKNQKPDHLPCQVHSWMTYYLDTYLNGIDSYQAYEYFGMDPVIYAFPRLIFDERSLKNWAYEYRSLGKDKDGVESFIQKYHTPKGDLTIKGARNQFTSWETEPMIKNENDFELYKEFFPVPVSADWGPIVEAKNKIGDKGIVRTWCHSCGQPGTWQCFASMIGTENAIYKAMDEPDWVHYALKIISDKAIATIENMGKIPADLVENGGRGVEYRHQSRHARRVLSSLRQNTSRSAAPPGNACRLSSLRRTDASFGTRQAKRGGRA